MSKHGGFAGEADRGQMAASPGEIPALGWWDIGRRTVARSGKNGILLVAAGVTFYGLLAIVPALAAFMTFYGLFFEPGEIERHIGKASNFVPERLLGVVRDQLERVTAHERGALHVTFLASTIISMWSALAAIKAIIRALNIAYEEEETRSFLRLNGLALIFTFGAIVYSSIILAGVALAPGLLDIIGTGSSASTLARIARWPILLGLVLVVVAVLYRYAPSRSRPMWRWTTWGSGAAVIGWFVFSLIFSWYVSSIRNYDETHGSLGAIVVFMIWMWLSTAIILLGAELNAEIERQTMRDTTEGRPGDR